jgi:DNA polymerase (family X)
MPPRVHEPRGAGIVLAWLCVVNARSAAHALSTIGDLPALTGRHRFQAKAFRGAARAVRSLGVVDLAPLVRSGALRRTHGIGPTTFGVLEELIETGDSSMLDRLREQTPVGLIEVARVPSLRLAQVHRLHDELGIDSLDTLESAVRDGRLARLPKIGPKTVAKILAGIGFVRQTAGLRRYDQAVVDAREAQIAVESHPDIVETWVAGSIRRVADVVRDIDLVAECAADPAAIARSLGGLPGVSEATQIGPAAVRLVFVDGLPVDVFCAVPEAIGAALWLATGSRAHCEALAAPPAVRTEEEVYARFGLPYIEPELREACGEIEAAREGRLPVLITERDVRGVLHTHTDWSDGTASVSDMAAAAIGRSWEYLGISDHSQAAFYAGGLSPEAIRAQQIEIDEINVALDGRCIILKGIEVDILPDGRLDYDAALLDTFDFVIASVHSRFSMERAAMTQRVVRALGDPHVTVLGHPTGRLLLSRTPYDIDLDVVLAEAAARGVGVELNADPHRLDLDWRWCRAAKRLGCAIAIGPDAHSPAGLGHTELGVKLARKGWIERIDLMNSRQPEALTRRVP